MNSNRGSALNKMSYYQRRFHRNTLACFTVILLCLLGLFRAADLALRSDTRAQRGTTQVLKDAHDVIFRKPGFFWDGKIYVWGARLTTSYFDEALIFLDFWILGQFQLIKGRVVFHDPGVADNLLKLDALRSTRFSCIHPGSRVIAPCDFFPNANVDEQSGTSYYRVRCNLTGDAKWDLKQTVNLRILVSSEAQSWLNTSEPVVEFHIRRLNDAVGFVGPENPLPTPFFEHQPVDLILCVGGISETGMPFLPEFIQHHLRVGVDKFVVGLHGAQDSSLYRNTQELLWPLIEAGVIYLYPTETPPDFAAFDRDAMKTLFYEGCLFHAKGQAEFVANWDIDEFWMPVADGVYHDDRNRTSVTEIINSSSTIVDQITRHLQLPIWQMQGARSRTLRREQTRIGDTFRFRGAINSLTSANDARLGLNYVWKKSIAKTKNTFNSGFHVFGSCLLNGDWRSSFNDGHYSRPPQCSIRAPNNGLMHHYLGLFYYIPDAENMFNSQPLVRDEYSLLVEQLGYQVTVRSFRNGSRFIFNRVPGVPQQESVWRSLCCYPLQQG